jgi:hypothetical protein
MMGKAPFASRALTAHTVSVSAAFAIPGFPAAVIIDHRWRIHGFRYPSTLADIDACLSVANELVVQEGLEQVARIGNGASEHTRALSS